MSKFWSVGVLPVVLLAAAGRAGAQSAVDMAAASCPVDVNSATDVKEAEVIIVEALDAKTDSARKVALRSAGKALTKTVDPKVNPGRSWEIGRIAALWLALPDQPVVTNRAQLGWGGDPTLKTDPSTQRVDLSVMIDSNFAIVEKAIPSCVPSTSDWRQQPGWQRLVKLAVRQANDSHFDSAAVTVAEASRIYADHPYPLFVMGQIAEAKGDHKAAIARFNEAIDKSMTDSSFAPVRETAENTVGQVAVAAARTETNPDDKKFYLAAAKDAYTKLAKEPGGGTVAQAGLTQVARLSGDASAATAAYKVVMDDPAATYSDLIDAGVAAGSAHQMGDAIALFRRAVAVNAYQRDALFNLAFLLAQADSGMSARPFVDRLVAVDPSNPDDYLLAQTVYAMMQSTALSVARRDSSQAAALTQPGDAARSKALRDSAAAWTDSAATFEKAAFAFLNKKDGIAVAVAFNVWTPKTGSVTLGGRLTNTTGTAKTVTVHVEFLDKAGNTVTSKDVNVTVDPKGSKDFTLTGDGVGITAFKYAPISA
ncbi:MAG TPA: hypothetical protein VMH39_01730 [Gemmatimonadaceae bacterium]|nr:hypothetical protein [Gemmatimonadaceae bacterium]